MNSTVSDELDAVVVGAGFAGLYMLHRLRGMGYRARVFEAGGGVGGTWYWNRYPGARCDVESMEYSYQFSDELQQEWEWSERYAAQPEILRYAEHVADRFDLRRDIRFDTRVTAAHFDDATRRWRIETDRGDRATAQFCIMATGCLSCANTPEFPGGNRFRGATYHTGQWPHAGVDFTGRHVAIVGTGSSAIQSIPHIAAQAAHLYVFQRTPNYSVPAHNRPMDPEFRRRIKADYANFRASNRQQLAGFAAIHAGPEQSALEVTAEERDAQFEKYWQIGGLMYLFAFADLFESEEANRHAGEFVRRKIREIVKDPAIAELLCPDTMVGCKRLCADTGYFETFNRSNVTLVDVSTTPIEAITETAVRVAGIDYPVDDLVFATGFDAMTGSLFRIDIRGRAGTPLREKWAAGPRTYLGLQTAGFPNLFVVTGPGSPSVLSNMIPSIEQHVEFIASAIRYVDERQKATIEPEAAAEDAWVEHVNEVANATLYPTCNSWYLGANVPGKPRVFMPYLGFPEYCAKCEEVVARDYEGFALA
jgi:cation diffusion facilitator CzcD-associated flavoprotein CzcO